jgi:hypothetical protein
VSTAPGTEWTLTVEHLIACNCDWGCPCIYQSKPTPGFCEGIVSWRVLEGAIGGVDLAGAIWVTAVKWPGAIHEGDGRATVFIDEKTTAEQRPVIEELATGRAGGPLKFFMGTCDAGIDVRSANVGWTFEGKKSSIRINGVIDVDLEAIRNPVTGEEHFVSVDLATGLMNQREDVYSARVLRVRADGIQFDYTGRHAATSVARWTAS